MKLNGTSGFFLVYTKTWTGYRAYRKDHPGPMSRKSLYGLGMVDGIGRGSSGPNRSKWVKKVGKEEMERRRKQGQKQRQNNMEQRQSIKKIIFYGGINHFY